MRAESRASETDWLTDHQIHAKETVLVRLEAAEEEELEYSNLAADHFWVDP